MPYPAPVDVGAVSGFECYLVFIPDDEAYLQAAWGAYTDMAHQWNWGKDSQHEDSEDIEQHWLEAIALTAEEIGVSKLDTIIGHIDQLEDLIAALEASGACCDPPASLLPIDAIPDAGYQFEGSSYPSTWGDGEAIASQADYDEVLCAMAHRYVDNLAHIGQQIDELMTVGVITVSLLAGLLAAVSSLGLFAIFAYATASAGVTEMISGWVASLFTTASAAIETAREDIVCAFLTGNSSVLSDEVEATVSAASWTAFFQFLDYVSPFNAAQTGEFNGEYIAIDRNDTCDCSSEFTAIFDWDTTLETWVAQSRSAWYDEGGGEGSLTSHPKQGNPPDPTYCTLNRPNLATKAGTSDAGFKLDYIKLSHHAGEDADQFFVLGKEARCLVRYSDDSVEITEWAVGGTDLYADIDDTKELRSSAGGATCLQLGGISNGSAANGTVHFSTIEIGFRSA